MDIISAGSEGLGQKTSSNFSVKYDYKNYNNPFFWKKFRKLNAFEYTLG